MQINIFWVLFRTSNYFFICSKYDGKNIFEINPLASNDVNSLSVELSSLYSLRSPMNDDPISIQVSTFVFVNLFTFRPASRSLGAGNVELTRSVTDSRILQRRRRWICPRKNLDDDCLVWTVDYISRMMIVANWHWQSPIA